MELFLKKISHCFVMKILFSKIVSLLPRYGCTDVYVVQCVGYSYNGQHLLYSIFENIIIDIIDIDIKRLQWLSIMYRRYYTAMSACLEPCDSILYNWRCVGNCVIFFLLSSRASFAFLSVLFCTVRSVLRCKPTYICTVAKKPYCPCPRNNIYPSKCYLNISKMYRNCSSR